ncbi:MAG: RIP metalloprotease RseP [Deltaproteobacteria bacterium]|nr:RIP metalloprotease RseP [Deltaproteobacteria bacterium]
MTVFHSTAAFVVLLGVLVFVHEFGHFLVAKRLGIRVLKFSLGFGPRVWGWRRGETEYLISAVPLGGYVKLFGEDPDEPLAAGEEARSFSARPVSHRIATVVAGPLMNVVLAVVVFALLSLFGTPVLQPVVGQVSPGMPAEAAGLAQGDRIVAIDGEPVASWDDMAERIAGSGGRELVLTVERQGTRFDLRVKPVLRESRNLLGETIQKPMIGIAPSGEVSVERNPVWMAPWIGIRETARWTAVTVEVLVKMVVGRVSPRTLGGPIAIAKMAGETAQAGAQSFLFLMAVLSVNLAVLNLLPIPILDGGHLLFFGIEAVRGRPVSLRHREVAQQVGLAILLALMAFVMYNDLARILSG